MELARFETTRRALRLQEKADEPQVPVTAEGKIDFSATVPDSRRAASSYVMASLIALNSVSIGVPLGVSGPCGAETIPPSGQGEQFTYSREA